ncbi:MAG: rhomboid family intramembrane serine protease [Bryobacteraceae bacterium]
MSERSVPPGYNRHGGFPTAVKWLLISNTALFVLYFLLVQAGFGRAFYYFGLVPAHVIQIWGLPQLVTYMFLHDPLGFAHILFNMLTLWMFGADLERAWGTRRFLQYYFVCGVGAGLCSVIGNLFFGELYSRTIGASGAIYGLLLAYGVLWPTRTVLFSFLFPIQARYFVLIIGAIAFLSTLGASGSNVSHVAHLGGMIFGYFYLKSRFLNVNLLGSLRQQYKGWRMQRARRKFQVYLRKHHGRRDPRVH